MMKSSPCLRFSQILWKFDKHLLPQHWILHINLISSQQPKTVVSPRDNGQTLCLFSHYHLPQLPYIYAQLIAHLCYGAEDQTEGQNVCFWWQAEGGKNGCQQNVILLHSWQRRLLKLEQDAVRTMADKYDEATDSKKDSKAESKKRNLKSPIQQLEKTL